MDVNNEGYVYMTIPTKYVCIYNKLLIYMADFGKEIIDDCNAVCKGKGKSIIKCWNLFQSAMACYQLGLYKKTDLFIKYIIAELNPYYGNICEDEESIIILPIDNNGEVKVILNNKDINIKFEIDPNTGVLKQIKPDDEIIDFNIINNDLTVNNN